MSKENKIEELILDKVTPTLEKLGKEIDHLLEEKEYLTQALQALEQDLIKRKAQEENLRKLTSLTQYLDEVSKDLVDWDPKEEEGGDSSEPEPIVEEPVKLKKKRSPATYIRIGLPRPTRVILTEAIASKTTLARKDYHTISEILEAICMNAGKRIATLDAKLLLKYKHLVYLALVKGKADGWIEDVKEKNSRLKYGLKKY